MDVEYWLILESVDGYALSMAGVYQYQLYNHYQPLATNINQTLDNNQTPINYKSAIKSTSKTVMQRN
jgi:hypothetical protein